MNITDLRRIKGGLFEIECDGELFGILESDTVRRLSLAPGCEIDEEELAGLIETCAQKRAFDRALAMTARRELCRAMVLKKLSPDFGRSAAEAAADRLEELGLLSDRRFAEMHAADMYQYRHFYIRRVRFELRAKGIDSELAEEVAEELAPDQSEALRDIIENTRLIDLSSEKARRRAYAALTRYGYDGYAIAEALRQEEE